jgi:hypothetical protein
MLGCNVVTNGFFRRDEDERRDREEPLPDRRGGRDLDEPRLRHGLLLGLTAHTVIVGQKDRRTTPASASPRIEGVGELPNLDRGVAPAHFSARQETGGRM